MKKTVFIILTLLTLSSTAQNTIEKSIKYFEDCIINEISPSDAVAYKYDKEYRYIVWNDKLIKNYKYTNEEFDKLGYDYVTTTNGDKNQYSKIYRSCEKGILIEVTEWYNVKLSISIKWFEKNTRKGIAYLMYCDLNKQPVYNKGTLYTASYYGKGTASEARSNPIESTVEVFVGDNTVKVTLGNDVKTYKIETKPDQLTGFMDEYVLSLNDLRYSLTFYKTTDSWGVFYTLFFDTNKPHIVDNERIWTIPEATAISK